MNLDQQFLADLHITPERIPEPKTREGYERTEVSVQTLTLEDGRKIVLVPEELFESLADTNGRLGVEYEQHRAWRALLWAGWLTAGCLLALCVWLGRMLVNAPCHCWPVR